MTIATEQTTPRPLPDHVRVAIVGSGFSGLGMAIGLKQAGRSDFAVLERGPGVGGTWRDNDYPGAACDVPSRLYSFSFAPNPRWTRSFRPSRRSCATCATAASASGSTRTCTRAPRWTARTGTIGTGASAIQIVPKIQPTAKRLTVFQRTPGWIIPRTDRPFTRIEKAIYTRFPKVERFARHAIYWGRESYVIGFTRRPGLMTVIDRIARRHLARQVADPELRATLTPDYRIGCKRILISNDFYPALSAPNADVVTEPIREIRERTVVTADGVEHPADAIVFATGFQVTPPPIAGAIHGRDGVSLDTVWERDGMKAHRGTTIAGFPNLFMLVGPNTGLGHTSMVYVIEAQIRYVLEALAAMEQRDLATVAPRRDVQDRFNDGLQRRLARSIWQTGGCGSWYLDQHGNNVTLWPDFTFRFKALTEAFDVENYELEPAGAPTAVGARA